MTTIYHRKLKIKIQDTSGQLKDPMTTLDNKNPSAHNGEYRMDKIARELSFLSYVVEGDGRLMEAPKRSVGEAGWDFNHQPQLRSRTFNTHPEVSRPKFYTADGSKAIRKRSHSLPAPARNARHGNLVEHAAPTMSGESPGPRQPRYHSKDPNVLNDPAVDHDVASMEIENSEASYENEGKLEKATRVKPNTGQKKEKRIHSSEIIAEEERVTPIHRDAHDDNKPNERKDASGTQKSAWGSQWRDGSRKVEPDYSPPDTGLPHTRTPNPRLTAMKRFGGPRPINRLSDVNSSPPFKPKRQADNPNKPFDFTNGRANYNPPNPRKRQKVDGGSSLSNGSPKEIYDVDTQTTNFSKRRDSSTVQSGQSFSQNGMKNKKKPVPEFSNVEDQVKPRPRPRNRPSSIKRNHSSSEVWLDEDQPSAFVLKPGLTMEGHGTVRVPEIHPEEHLGEDPSDLISNDSDELELQDERVLSSDFGVQALIPSPKPIEKPRSSYQGTANRMPARQFLNSQTSRQSQSGQISKHFPPKKAGREPNGNRETSLSSIGSRSSEDHVSMNGMPLAKARTGHSINGRVGFDSPDHLVAPQYSNRDEQGIEVAEDLISRLRQTKGPSAHAKKASRLQRVDLTSEDELQSQDHESQSQNKADILRTIFTSSKEPKQKQTLEEGKYEVLQVFSQGSKWLLRGKPWSLIFEANMESFLFDGEGASGLVMKLTSVQKIEFNKDNSKIVIHKHRDTSFNNATLVCVTFGDSCQSNEVVSRLESSTGAKLLRKTPTYLDKVFETTAKQPEKISMRLEEPADIQLAMARSEARNSAKWDKVQDAKKPAHGGKMTDQMTSEERRPETRSGLRSKETKSSEPYDLSDDQIEDNPKRQSRHTAIPSAEFYKSRSSDQYELRSSVRIASRDSAPKPRTPSPVRWTELESNKNWSDSWKSSIIYPREGKNRATVDLEDIKRLDEGQFLNDSLINFYLRWLEHRLMEQDPALAKRIYFNNTFFYKTLTTVTKRQKGINYEAVERWTSRVDLLSYDYIIVPVNEHTHWYVAIICNAPKLVPTEPKVRDLQTLENSTILKEESVGTKREPSPSSPAPPKPIQPNAPEVEAESFGRLSIEDAEDEFQGFPEIGRERGNDRWQDPDPDPEIFDRATSEVPRIAIPDSFDGPSDRDVDDFPSVDLLQAGAKKSTPSKKGKRKSTAPAPRKYNPKEPRIITLDSLGVKHSPTCTNLRDYIVAEVKSKRLIEIPPPGSLGTTATNIPQQNNYCDCGVFLLSYVERFIANPDGFVHDILQNTTNLETKWPEPSAMRNQIRELLFDIQKEQTAEAEKLKQMKARGKKKLTPEKQVTAAVSPESREGSGGARTSSTPDHSNRDIAPPSNKPIRSSPQPSAIATSHSRKRSASRAIPKPLDEIKRSRKEFTPERKIKETPAKSESSRRGVHNLDDEEEMPGKSTFSRYPRNGSPPGNLMLRQAKHAPCDDQSSSEDAPIAQSSGQGLFGGIVSSFSKVFGGKPSDKPTNRIEAPLPGASRSTAVEIEESPEKASQEYFHSPAALPVWPRTYSRSPSPEEVSPPRSTLKDRPPTPFRHLKPLPHADHEEQNISDSSPSPALNNIEMHMEASPIVLQDDDDQDEEMLLNGRSDFCASKPFGAEPLEPDQLSSPTSSHPAAKGQRKDQPKAELPTSRRHGFSEQGREQEFSHGIGVSNNGSLPKYALTGNQWAGSRKMFP